MTKRNANKPKFSPLTMSGDRLVDALFAESRRKEMTLEDISTAGQLTESTISSLLKSRIAQPKHQTIRSLATAVGARLAIIAEDGRIIDPLGKGA